MTWPQVPVHEVARIEIGGTPARAVARYWSENGEGLPWVSIADLLQPVVTETSEQISEAGRINSNVKLVPAGTTMMSFKLTVGRVAVAGCDLFTNEAIAAFHATSRALHPDWLKYSLPVAVRNVIADTAVKGVTLNKKSLRTLTIPFPSRPEQRAIAHVLTTLDDLIADTETAIAKLEAIRQGLLHDLLTRGLDENGELRQPRATEGLFNWEPLPFESYLRGTPQNGLYKPESAYTEQGDGAKIVRIDSFNNGDVVKAASAVLKTLRVSESDLKVYGLRSGDLMINRVNSIDWVGKTAIVDDTTGQEVFESNIMRCRVQEDRLRPMYALLLLSAPWSQKHFRARAKSAISQASINQGDIRSLPVAVPEVDEQDRVVAVVRDLDKSRAVAEFSRAVLGGLTAGIRDELLLGRTHVSPALLGLPPEDGDV